jgi:protein MpaA
LKRRPRPEWGTIPRQPEIYGRSVLGVPLEVWRPAGKCTLLLFAAIHGEEPETTFALSRALRQLAEPSPHCAVVLAANPDGLIRGTRGNARGVELNRNFPTADWQAHAVAHRSTLDDPQDILLSPGRAPGSEPETQALMGLVRDLAPTTVIALHAPLACINEASETSLGRWLVQQTGLPLLTDIGYPTPGSFGTWGAEQGLAVITYEFPLTTTDALVRKHVPVLVTLLTDPMPWS